MKNAFIGSTVAMVLAAMSFVSDFRAWPNLDDDQFFAGCTVILGAAAYRSAKQRRLGLKPNTGIRRGIEIALLILVLAPIPFALAQPVGIGVYKLSCVVVPAWSVIAWLVVSFKRIKSSNSTLGLEGR